VERLLLFCEESIPHYWQLIAGSLDLLFDLWATAHVVLNKRDSRSAVAWVGLIWLVPVVGPLLYFLLGVNRIRRRARALRRRHSLARPPMVPCLRRQENVVLPPRAGGAHLRTLARLVGEVTGRPLLPGNRVEPLLNGDQAFPAMLEAIDGARESVTLSTYIFDNDRVGRLFLGALGRAVARRAEVRVLVDGVGAHYAFPSILRPLRRVGVPVACFLPTSVPWSFHYANLREHRKILVVDGRIGFTGGMNMREGHAFSLRPRHPIQDLQLRIEGPTVAHLQEVFADDWKFCTGEVLQGERWFPPLPPAGPVRARGVASGPDDDLDKLRMIYLGALACARSSVRIITPYFLPDCGLIAALNTAALRGVEVDILLPRRNNLRLVQWASAALLWQVLEHGCRVWHTPEPFDHTKLVLVDGLWALLGSANWDPRSLRLNFEVDVECYDRAFAASLEDLVQGKLKYARPVTLDDMDGRPLPVRLRDGAARLLSPYL
jgi:cardiolipin synthase